MKRITLCLLTALLPFGIGCMAPTPLDAEYLEAIEEYRERRLRSAENWLTVAGLFWLAPGENRFGSDPENPVVLSDADIPPWAGSLFYEDESVRLQTAPDVTVAIGDQAVTERVLRDDTQEEFDVMELGRLSFYVIKRGEQVGIRVKDPTRKEGFAGLDHFPLDPAYRIDAGFKPFDEPRVLSIGTVVGTTETLLAPGLVEFSLDGKAMTLLPLVYDLSETNLWLIFKDETSGKETYGFRYLYAELADGRVDLDFNRTYNPPCAFTPHATCPLPPRENWLDARIEAGELIYGK